MDPSNKKDICSAFYMPFLFGYFPLVFSHHMSNWFNLYDFMIIVYFTCITQRFVEGFES